MHQLPLPLAYTACYVDRVVSDLGGIAVRVATPSDAGEWVVTMVVHLGSLEYVTGEDARGLGIGLLAALGIGVK